MTATVGRIRCKACDKVFSGLQEYLACNGCDKEECPMSKKWKARQAANEAIEAAQNSSKEHKFIYHERTCHMESEVSEDHPIREREMSHCISFHVMKR